MKSQMWKRIGPGRALAALALAGVLTLTGQTASPQTTPSSAEKQSASGTGLVGTWRVTVQLYDCATEAPIGHPFASLLRLNEGGRMPGATPTPVLPRLSAALTRASGAAQRGEHSAQRLWPSCISQLHRTRLSILGSRPAHRNLHRTLNSTKLPTSSRATPPRNSSTLTATPTAKVAPL